MSEVKKAFRQYFKIQWNNLAIDSYFWTFLQNQFLLQLVDFLGKETKSKPNSVWGIYFPMSKKNPEIDITGVLKISRLKDIEWCAPRMEDFGKSEMNFYSLSSVQLVKNQFGILEPQSNPKGLIRPHQLTGLFIPGLSFGNKGWRLGRGKGFYDKYLSKSLSENPKIVTVGICPENCLIDQVDLNISDPWDHPVDWIITQNKYFKTGIEKVF
jgi:5,10-methenyltetrahydrofolate synthetase